VSHHRRTGRTRRDSAPNRTSGQLPVGDSRRERRIASTAYHEAGHAVAGVVLGVPILEVTIVPSAGAHGSVRMPTRWVADVHGYRVPSRDLVERYVVKLLSGVTAQRKAYPRSVRFHHGRSDRESALSVAVLVMPDSEPVVQAFLNYCQARAVQLVEEHWPSVIGVAQELIVKRTVRQKDVRAVVAKHSESLAMRWKLARWPHRQGQ